jgi:superfamily II DNA or RNA helicase
MGIRDVSRTGDDDSGGITRLYAGDADLAAAVKEGAVHDVDPGLRPTTAKLLYPEQRAHVLSLRRGLSKCPPTGAAAQMDASPTGTGKTPCGMAVAREFYDNDPAVEGTIIACPLNVVDNWKSEATRFGVPSIIVNYETLKRGKVYRIGCERASTRTGRQARLLANFLILKRDEDGDIVDFEWRIPRGTPVIFDEAHLCGNRNSLNGRLLLAARRAGARILLLSASLAESSDNFAIFGMVLNCYSSMDDARSWIAHAKRNGGLNHALFPRYGSKLTVGGRNGIKLAGNSIEVEHHKLDRATRGLVDELWAEHARLKRCNQNLKRQHEIRSTIEGYLAKGFAERARGLVRRGRSVIIYVNYRETVEYLARLLKTRSIIQGGQDVEERQRIIKRFQTDRSRIIISNLRAGGAGISLHDTRGKYPRVILMRPGASSKDVKQGLGRTDRVGAVTRSHCYLAFADTPIEREWCGNLGRKLRFIDKITDDDMSPLASGLIRAGVADTADDVGAKQERGRRSGGSKRSATVSRNSRAPGLRSGCRAPRDHSSIDDSSNNCSASDAA